MYNRGVERVLVSACLLGDRVRYDGADKASSAPVLARWLAEGRVVRVCPEVLGGLPVPRPPAERRAGRVVTEAGHDVTAQFEAGAQAALALVRAHAIRVAVLKEHSPSCGSTSINDGSFTRLRIAGAGVTTERLRAHGVQVFSELEWEAADAALRSLR